MTNRPFQPARLRLARRLCGITQKDLAEQVGVSPAAISQFEAGAHVPSPQTLERLVVALRVAPDFFYRPLEADDEAPAFFRSLRRATKREQEKARSFGLLVGEIAELLDEDVELPRARIPSLPLPDGAPLEHVERAAEQIRRDWGVRRGPIAHMVRLLEAHGAIVVAVGEFDSTLDAFSLWVADRPVVVLCSDKGVPKRRRFDAAHELAHLVLHPRARSGDKRLEAQAHRFAAALLMPADEIEPFLPRRATQIEVVRQASETWGVSMQAVLFRARTLGTLSEVGYTRSMRRMSALGWRTDEPVEAGPEETPSVLGAAIDALHDAGGSTQQLATRLGVPHGRLSRMVAVPEQRNAQPDAEVVSLRPLRAAG